MASRSNDLPRHEHPQPQAVRSTWLSLNGQWEFAETNTPGNDSRYLGTAKFKDTIIVPFCRESSLSGLNRKRFVKSVWYRREFTIPHTWRGKRVKLHFGAVDWHARVWVNDKPVGSHTGGQAAFSFEITDALKAGMNTVVVNAFDDLRSGIQAGGKQSRKPKSHGCSYTRTTGIWQTVWLEAVGETFVEHFAITPDPDNKCVHLEVRVNGPAKGLTFQADVLTGKSPRASGKARAAAFVRLTLPLKSQRLWSVRDPFLYSLRLTLSNSKGDVDTVASYFGQRNIEVRDGAVLLNGEPIFQRLVLDQGFYPDGIWTAPTDEALKRDIKLAMAAGFNGARLHQKVFEPRFLYWADKLGFLVWGEYANWGLNHADERVSLPIIDEWQEVIVRDRNHPSIVGWCPFNETSAEAAALQNSIVALTRNLDPTRPVIDASGWFHSTENTDVYDVHDYDQNPETFRQRWQTTRVRPPNNCSDQEWAHSKPFFVSEYGGIGWHGNDGAAWGYGNSPKTKKAFIERYAGLTNALLDNPDMFGFCYTQLYDVEQEQNGLYTYERKPKVDIKTIRKINTRKAAYENTGRN